ncbi:MAG: hypothetical protein WC083_04155 [Candidatus Methanomethylophilaceae archaeon]
MGVALIRGLLKPFLPWDYMAKMRERIVLNQLSREFDMKMHEINVLREALLSTRFVPGDSDSVIFKTHKKSSDRAMLQLAGDFRPWIDWDRAIEEHEAAEMQKDVENWENTYGSLDDPEILNDCDALAAHLLGY